MARMSLSGGDEAAARAARKIAAHNSGLRTRHSRLAAASAAADIEYRNNPTDANYRAAVKAARALGA